ncbi:MAG: hypothetical protein ABJN34_01530 [Litoreibacter sp.]|uniref:hypothetical protein n=1 Tax=Litoreibacter sp. TaxID=1969459 RepID=UPI003296E73C
MMDLNDDNEPLTVAGSLDEHLAAAQSLISQRLGDGQRNLVAVAGPPAVGKSSFAETLVDRLNADAPDTAVLLPMDGFHLDNAMLDQKGLLDRKGAPPTFDFEGFASLLSRVRNSSVEHYLPVFDRALDISVAGARSVPETARTIVAEGNYLLLDRNPWHQLKGLFDLSIFIEASLDQLRSRLIERWIEHGYDMAGAEARALLNDIPNAEHVMAHRLSADLICQQAA